MKYSKNDCIKIAFAKQYSFGYLQVLNRELTARWEVAKFQKHFGTGKTTAHRKAKRERKANELKTKVHFLRQVIQIKKNLNKGHVQYPEYELEDDLYSFLDLSKQNIYVRRG